MWKYRNIGLVMLLCGIAFSCNDSNNAEQTQQAEQPAAQTTVATEEEVRLPADAVPTTAIADTSSFVYQQRFPAEVEAAPNNEFIITSPIAGRISTCYVHEGEMVQKGKPVLIVESLEFNTMMQELIVAHNEKNTALLAFQRTESLAQKEISPTKTVEATKLAMQNANARFAVAVARLKTVGLSDSEIQACLSGNVPSSLILRSGLSGKVQQHTVVPGQYVQAGQNLMNIINNADILIKVFLPVTIAPSVRAGDSVVIGEGNTLLRTTITAIAPAVDTSAQAVIAFIHAKNTSLTLVPGIRTSAAITLIKRNAELYIPASAVEIDGNTAAVYVRIDSTHFRHRTIELGERLGENYLVRKGLDAGETIATTQLFLLKSLRRSRLLEEE